MNSVFHDPCRYEWIKFLWIFLFFFFWIFLFHQRKLPEKEKVTIYDWGEVEFIPARIFVKRLSWFKAVRGWKNRDVIVNPFWFKPTITLLITGSQRLYRGIPCCLFSSKGISPLLTAIIIYYFVFPVLTSIMNSIKVI